MPSKSTNLNRPSNGTSCAENSQVFTVYNSRPFPSLVSHKSFLRVNIHRSALNSLGLKAGEVCLISEVSEDGDQSKAFPAIAWLSADPHVQKHVVLISENLRKLLGVGFENKVNVGKYVAKVENAGAVTVKEVNIEDLKNVTEMSGLEREGWKWFLEHIFVETKYIYEGLVFNPVEYKGRKRAFIIEKVKSKGSTTGVGAGLENLSLEENNQTTIPAYKMTETSTVDIFSESYATTTPILANPKSSTNSGDLPQVESSTALATASRTNFASIGGLDSQINTLKSLLLSTLHQSHHFTRFNLTPPRGILLYGPPGTGKTLLLKAVASELNAKCFVLNGSVVGKYMGESEAAVRKVFAEARKNQPAIIFIDEVDSLAPKRGVGDGGEGRVVSTLLTELDGMNGGEDEAAKVVVVAATNRPNAIDEALRRPGRFDREIEIGIPDVDARREILRLLMKELPFDGDGEREKDDFVNSLAGRTHGFVGADLEALVRGGFTIALKRLGIGIENGKKRLEDESSEQVEQELTLRESDIEAALKDVRPTAMREIFLEPPKVRWSDIGGQEEVKQRLREAVEWPLTHPEVFARLGGTPRKGLLLYGPPGCSKTLTAKALATEAGLNFMAVKGPELFSMYVGESERAVREVFRKARAASPSIIFFDEIDALSASRSGEGGRGGTNVLTALLNEMDGIESLTNVTILAATNRPEIIDPALMRPGRLDTILYVGPPDLAARREILKIKARKMSISPEVELEEMAKKTDGYSGAEIVNICDEAIHYAMRESFEIDAVGKRHFDMAMEKAVPQITAEMTEAYEKWSVGGVKKI